MSESVEIHKYKLEITDRQEVAMPIGAKILSVANQGDNLCLWAMVDRYRETRVRSIEIIGTGNPVPPEDRTFIGTVLIGPFAWHVFEGGE